MEIDVTHMIDDSDSMFELSGSRMEHGENASAITWRNSVAYGKDQPLLKTDDERDAARKHFRGYGAWSQEQIDAWSEDELQGIMCQDVAAAVREMEHYDSAEDYQKASEDGRCSGRLYQGGDRRWYFYLGL